MCPLDTVQERKSMDSSHLAFVIFGVSLIISIITVTKSIIETYSEIKNNFLDGRVACISIIMCVALVIILIIVYTCWYYALRIE